MKTGSFNELAPLHPEVAEGKTRAQRRRIQRTFVKKRKWEAAGVRIRLAPWQVGILERQSK